MSRAEVDAALARPDYENAAVLNALDALGPDIVEELEQRIGEVLPRIVPGPGGYASGPDALQLFRLTVALGRHLARQGRGFPESLDGAMRLLVNGSIDNLRSPQAVIEAVGSVPVARREALLLTSRNGGMALSFWGVLPACPTGPVLRFAVDQVLGWEKGRTSPRNLPDVAVGLFVACGEAAVAPLSEGILKATKEVYRDVLVQALAQLPTGGSEALVHALGDSGKGVVAAAGAGLVSRRAEAVPALDAAIATTKKKALLSVLTDIRGQIGPVDVETGKTATATPLESARQTHGERAAQVKAALTDPKVTTHRDAMTLVGTFLGEPEALLLALVDLSLDWETNVGRKLVDPVFVLIEHLRTLGAHPVAPWAVAAMVANRVKGPGRKGPAESQFSLLAAGLGDALRPAMIATLGSQPVVFAEIYMDWLAANPAADCLELFSQGLGGPQSRTCEAGLVALGLPGARAAVAALADKKKARRLAAAAVLEQVPTPSLADQLQAALASEKDPAVAAKLDAAVGALSADLI